MDVPQTTSSYISGLQFEKYNLDQWVHHPTHNSNSLNTRSFWTVSFYTDPKAIGTESLCYNTPNFVSGIHFFSHRVTHFFLKKYLLKAYSGIVLSIKTQQEPTFDLLKYNSICKTKHVLFVIFGWYRHFRYRYMTEWMVGSGGGSNW